MKKKILVITGDPLMLRILQQNLNECDYEVISTRHSGEELKTVIDEELPDLVILDTRNNELSVDLLTTRKSGSYNPN
ncbi:hypothetical protein ACFLUO_05795 [Chloroflexota bacterium]